MKPRIAIPTPTSADHAYNVACWPQYAEAIRGAGGEPVELPVTFDASRLTELLRGCDAICLPGSPADVDPALYGAERDGATARADSAREATDTLLLTEAWTRDVPLLGICFGAQMLNVWRGGTLIQDLLPLPVNHAAGASVAVAHSALVAADSLLGGVLLADSGAAAECAVEAHLLRVPVNTSHHQAVLAPGDDLRIVARSPEDGVVEAVEIGAREGKPRFLMGVQWHPERTVGTSAASRAIFARLVKEAAAYQVRAGKRA